MVRFSKQQNLRIIPLGGLGEVGRNMMLFEWKEQILIIDLGFRMPEEDMPGIDFLIPNIKYLDGKQDKILGVILTHGHYDHIGAIPYFVDRLGYPTFYAAPLTAGIVKKRQDDFPHLKKLDIEEVKPGNKVKIGPFAVEFFHTTHNIPDDLGLIIRTPVGAILHTSDFKFDKTPVYDRPSDIQKLKEMSREKVLLLLSDSTGAETAGEAISEKTIQENLEIIFQQSKGRIISATFASLLSRIQQVITLSEKYGRKVIVEGYSMKTNVEIAKNLKYLKIGKHTIIPAKSIDNWPDSKITVLCTGAQGEGNAVLMRIANKEHPHIKLKRGDSVIFSSSVIPGNERTVQFLKDNLYRQGAEVFHYKMMDIHASGHAQIEDLKRMIELVRPRFFMPVHGQYSMLINHAKIAETCGIPAKNIAVLENGQILNLSQREISVDKKTVPSNYIFVDGLGIGDVGNVVLRDRQLISKDGMFVIVAIVDRQTGRVRGNPDIISRGFVYLRESKDLLAETRRRTIHIVEKSTGGPGAVNWSYVKDNIRDKIGEFLYQKTQRRPMVLPVVIEV